MKKTILSALCITSVLFANGCTGAKDAENKSSATQNSEATEIGKEKKINDIKIKITEVKVKKDDTISENEKLIQLKFDIKNDSKETFGIGTGDFYVKDKDGKKYEMFGQEDNFGDVIQTKKSLQGNGYYKVEKDAKDLMLVYSPIRNQDKEQKNLEWKIGNPGK